MSVFLSNAIQYEIMYKVNSIVQVNFKTVDLNMKYGTQQTKKTYDLKVYDLFATICHYKT